MAVLMPTAGQADRSAVPRDDRDGASAGRAAEGQLSHTEGGYLIAVVRGSKESADSFVSDVQRRACRWSGFEGQPEEHVAGGFNPETAAYSTRALG